MNASTSPGVEAERCPRFDSAAWRIADRHTDNAACRTSATFCTTGDAPHESVAFHPPRHHDWSCSWRIAVAGERVLQSGAARGRVAPHWRTLRVRDKCGYP
jgi:hypothetical protein